MPPGRKNEEEQQTQHMQSRLKVMKRERMLVKHFAITDSILTG